MSTKLTVLIFLCCWLVMADAGRVCQSCNGLNGGEFCPRMEKCSNDEVCFTQKYLSNNNEVKIDVGCAYPELCIKDATGQILGRKRDHSHILCHQCCNDTDICNAYLTCDEKPTVSKQMCMSCEGINDPFNCNVTTDCLEDEICYMHKFTTNDQTFYDLGCKHSLLCTHGFANGLGRRRSSQGTHQVCESCCFGTPSCNRDLQCDHHILNKQSTDNDRNFCKDIYGCTDSEKPVNGTCSSNTECSQNLICKHGLCVCPNKEYYLNGPKCTERKGEHSSCIDNIECKVSMLCKNNSCSCDDGFYWSGLICSNKKTINSQCESSSECENTLFCIYGRCVCAKEYDYWNGSQCLHRKTINSQCESSSECEDTLFCIHERCVCAKEYYYWNGSQCLLRKDLNDSCGGENECKGPLVCRENTCQCDKSRYWNGSSCSLKHLECEDINSVKDGVYTIFPGGEDKQILVYCMIREGKKWTVIQRRYNGSVDFYRTWQEYKEGFGSAYGEYWIGNEYIHLISNKGHHEITIYMENKDGYYKTANYSTFLVANETQNYQLTITGYSGDAVGDSMDKVILSNRANGMYFTTKDRDNDRSADNCAVSGHSAWWYSDCYWSDFNKRFGESFWAQWRGDITKSFLAIRRR